MLMFDTDLEPLVIIKIKLKFIHISCSVDFKANFVKKILYEKNYLCCNFYLIQETSVSSILI